MLAKNIIVVDENVNVHDPREANRAPFQIGKSHFGDRLADGGHLGRVDAGRYTEDQQ